MSINSAVSKRPAGMLGLVVVLAGQAISILASSMVEFAVSIWVFEQTGSATVLGGMVTAFTVPFLLLTPVAGVMVDRYSRKLMMMASDITASLGTVAILILHLTGHLQIWHFYIVNVLVGIGSAFHWPAYSAAITTMVPKEQYGRANGMISFVEAGPGIVAPMLAGILLPLVQLQGILFIDLISLALAICALLTVSIPKPAKTVEVAEGESNILKEALFGFTYIFKRPSLTGFVVIVFLSNLFCGFCNAVLSPLILSRTGNSSVALGSVQMAGAASFAIGGIVIGIWGGPRRRLNGFLIGWSLFWLFNTVFFGMGRSPTVWIPLSLVGGMFATMGTSSGQSILQVKVAPDAQGRVFTARRLLTWGPDMVTPLLGGMLADRVMEPAMRSGGRLARSFGWLTGTGVGAGMSVQMIVFGVLTILSLLAGFILPKVRNMEDILPDHDQMEKVTEEAATELVVNG